MDCSDLTAHNFWRGSKNFRYSRYGSTGISANRRLAVNCSFLRARVSRPGHRSCTLPNPYTRIPNGPTRPIRSRRDRITW